MQKLLQSPPARYAMARLHQSPGLYGIVKKVADLRGCLPAVSVEGIPGRVHRNDFMALNRAAYANSSLAF